MRFQFDDFLVDDDTRQVLRGGSGVHLSPKAFDLLATLIRERPRALSKADLHTRLWPKTFVSDASLAMLVAEVRAALGETARKPRCVRTVHRHGYAFQGKVSDGPHTRRITDRAALTKDDAAIVYWLVTAAREIALVAGENIVGRDPKVRVWLDSPSVSRRHARINVEPHRVTLEDLGSKNGTRARALPVTSSTPVEDGDQLHFGSVAVTFKTWAADPTRSEAESK